MIAEIATVGDCDKVIADLLAAHKSASDEEDSFLWKCTDREQWFGIWFRGEPDEPNTRLEPSVFRPIPSTTPSTVRYFEEQSVYNYARNRVLQTRDTPCDLFTSLTYLQHYGTPTRLLDWTEGMLVALYFAVKDLDRTRDGWLYCLNSRKLNKRTGMKEGWVNIHDDASFGTLFRAEFVVCERRSEWFHNVASYSKFRWEDVAKYRSESKYYLTTGVPERALDDHCEPVAVLPRFRTTRQQMQRTAFTLHGGKRYSENRLAEVRSEDRIPEPVSLYELNKNLADREKFLPEFRIPAASKELIRKQLLLYGIHEGTLFPDSDLLGMHVKEMFS